MSAVLWPAALHFVSPWTDSRTWVWLLHDVLLPGGALVVLAFAARADRYHMRGIVTTAIVLVIGVSAPYLIWAYLYEWTNRGSSAGCGFALWVHALPLFIVFSVASGLALSRDRRSD
jgi:hypothetical protein